MKPRIRRDGWENLAIAGLFAAAWLLYPKLYSFTGDPPQYMHLAYSMEEMAGWDMDHPFPHRVGLLLPHYLAYRLFGFNQFSAFLPQLGFLLLMLSAVLRCCSGLPQKIVAALAMFSLIPWAAVLWPDLGVACCMFLALHILDRRRQEKLSGALGGALFSLAAFYAFLIKAIAGFLALPYLFALGIDLHRRYRRRHQGRLERGHRPVAAQGAMRFHRAALLSGGALLASYLLAYRYAFGDAFSRFDAINAMGGSHIWAIQGIDAYLRRFFVQPAHAFGQLFGFVFILALAQAAVAFIKRAGNRLVACYLLAGTLFAVFAPTSLSAWQPLPLTVHADGGRHLLFLAPAAAVLAAQLVGGWLSRPYPSLSSSRGHLLWGCLPRAYLSRAYGIAVRALAAACMLLIACHSALKVSRIYDSPEYATDQARRAAMRGLIENPRAELILSTGREHYNFIFYVNFDRSLYARVHRCDTGPITAPDKDAIVVIDKPLSAFLRSAYGERHCNKELMALMKAHGAEPLIDNRRLYLSFQHPRP